LEKKIDGWHWWKEPDSGPAITEPWLNYLKTQTLPQVPDGRQGVFYLSVAGLPPAQVPVHDTTVLERLAWALLCHPEAGLAVQPLYLATGATGPVFFTGLDGEPAESIARSGFIALARESVRHAAGEAGVGPGAALEAAIQSGFPVLVLPRALLHERQRLELAQPARIREGVQGKLRKAARRYLSPTQRGWLRRQWQRWSVWRREWDEPAAAHPEDPWLARRRVWEPRFPHPALALRVNSADTRTTVWFAVHWLELGGAEKFAVNLIRALPKDRYRIVVTTDIPSRNPWLDQVAEHAEEIFHLPDFLTEPMFGIFAAHLVASRDVRLLHIHHAPRIYAALFHIRRFAPRLKVLHTLHILELPPHPGGYPEHTLRHYGAFIDHHHVISHHLERFLRQRWFVPREHIDTVYLNVDTEGFDPARVPKGEIRKTHGIAPEAVVVGFVGRLTRQKRPLAFIAMARLLAERWRAEGRAQELHFVMAGDGDLQPDVEAAVRAVGLERVLHLHGEVVDPRPVYADCDLMVLPSENEGLALVSYEAMAMACPIVCTNVGAQRELVPREWLVADGEGPELAGRLAKKVWELAVDAGRRQDWGERGRRHVLAHHRQAATWEAMQAIYARLLGTGADSARWPEMPNGDGWRLADPAAHPADNRPRVVAAVVSYNHRDALLRLLAFLDERGIPTVVTENGSTDGTREAIRGRFASVTVLESPANLGGTGGFNCAVLAALGLDSDYVLLIDDDALPAGDCIERLADFLDRNEDYAFAAPAIYIAGTEATLQEAGGGVDFSRPWPVEAWYRFQVRPPLPPHLDVDYASACCLMVRSEDVREVGVMDWNFFIFSDDVDWTLRLRQSLGKRGACVTEARAFHEFPWAKPFSPLRLYYFNRNGLYLVSRFADGDSRRRAIRWALRRPLRRLVYAALIGDREVARTLWRSLRDAWSRRYGRWRDPVVFPDRRPPLDAEFMSRQAIRRVLVDITIEDLSPDILAALRGMGDTGLRVDLMCDGHRVEFFRRQGLFGQVWGRTPGLSGPLKDWWRIYRSGYDLVITDAGMEPRRPASLAGRRAAFFHAGVLYQASAASGWAPLAYGAGLAAGMAFSAALCRRFLIRPELGSPSEEAAQLLESIGYDGAIGQPWARLDKTDRGRHRESGRETGLHAVAVETGAPLSEPDPLYPASKAV
jgi:GT2 family glycosyltransferase/glycosyltransferase involved in cell wall biosynthesis